MMGGNQSYHKGKIDDVFEYFEKELKTWTDISNNLKQSWEDKTTYRGWIPAYLLREMEDTEKRWKEIKSIIVPPRDNVGKEASSDRESHVPQNLIESKGQRIDENNETFDLKKQETELTNKKQTPSKADQQVPPIPPKLGKRKVKQPIQPDNNSSTNSSISEILSTCEDVLKSPENRVIKKLIDFEENCEKENKKPKSEIAKLSIEIESLNSQIKRLENELELKERLSKQTLRSEEKKTEQEQDERQQENNGKARENETEETKGSLKKGNEAEGKTIIKRNKNLKDNVDKPQAEKDKTNQTDKNENSNQQNDKNKEIAVRAKDAKNSTGTIKLHDEINMLKAQNDSLETCVCQLREEKNELLLRLSRLAGEKLVQNNPAVADLSDTNRPTKLAEYYSELYDNEWTNAFETLESAGYSEDVAIETLCLTLHNVHQFCEAKAELLMKKVSDAVNLLFKEYQQTVLAMKVPSHLTMPRQNVNAGNYLAREKSSLDEMKLQRRWKPKCEKECKTLSSENEQMENIKHDAENKLKTWQKEMAFTMVPILQKAYIQANWTQGCIEEIKPFIMKCLHLCWMMKVQSPPMVFHKCETEKGFDRNIYKEYQTSGPQINFVVWPALLLHADGPLVCKGVAEGKKNT